MRGKTVKRLRKLYTKLFKKSTKEDKGAWRFWKRWYNTLNVFDRNKIFKV